MARPTPPGSSGHRGHARGPVRLALQKLLPFVNWNHAYAAWSYTRSALWVMPILALVGALLFTRLMVALDGWISWDLTTLAPEGARALFQTVITLTLSFLIFTFGSLLVAIQIAGGQLTPRIIATTLLRDRVIRYTAGLSVFTMLIAIGALNRTAGSVYELLTFAVACFGTASLASFLFLIDYSARLLRPVRIVELVCDDGMEVIRAMYPETHAGNVEPADGRVDPAVLAAPARTVLHAGRSRVLLTVDLDLLVEEARRHDGIIEVAPQIGDFVAADEPLFLLHGGARDCDDDALREAAALGNERTMEQDPMFAFRILVDVALKALSPAINDPTTAVLALDQIHRLLRLVGKRRLQGEQLTDHDGRLRVVFRTPNWEDFVQVSCSEIRACGANNLQIARRLRAMLENLIRSLPPERHAALRQQLDLLDRTLPGLYPLEEDLALARIPDPQGLGGSTMRCPRT
ncbi:MAG: DUF2254 domain-containing protein [Steroidobacteraceae bacterium]|jgi:uncharacterized membrane protein|nr:DUF2254 domain-containing protein [Steroidobacteraceae bacterium]